MKENGFQYKIYTVYLLQKSTFDKIWLMVFGKRI